MNKLALCASSTLTFLPLSDERVVVVVPSCLRSWVGVVGRPTKRTWRQPSQIDRHTPLKRRQNTVERVYNQKYLSNDASSKESGRISCQPNARRTHTQKNRHKKQDATSPPLGDVLRGRNEPPFRPKLPIIVGYDAMERSPTFSGGRGALVDRRRPDRGASPFRPRTTERGGKSWPPERGSLVLFYACKIKGKKRRKRSNYFALSSHFFPLETS